ncbi:MAG: DUF1786 family protein, partial [Candidatus Hodarchaeota archaeon]
IIGGHPFVHGLEKVKKAGYQIVFTETAALSLKYDLNVVHSLGFEIIDDNSPQVEDFISNSDYLSIELVDVNFPRLGSFLEECQIGISEIDVVMLCAQDHGLHAPGESAREVRFEAYREALERTGNLSHMLYGKGEVPQKFPRLIYNFDLLQEYFPNTKASFVMDSSPAVLLGGKLGYPYHNKAITVVNLGNGHTLIATLGKSGEVYALCEHHTGKLRNGHLDEVLRAYFAKELTSQQILTEGGHGVLYKEEFETGIPNEILAIGPRRAMTKASRLSFRLINPLGLSMMMAGPLGMIAAYEERMGITILEKP